MKRQTVAVFVAVIFLVLMVPVLANSVEAFNKKGPTPIPGDLIPFPGSHGHKKVHDNIIPLGNSK